jgi:hypothetical protein
VKPLAIVSAALLTTALIGSPAAAHAGASAGSGTAGATGTLACHWFGASVTHRPGFDVILWEYSCDGGRHCQVVSRGWKGKMTVRIQYGATVLDSVTGYLIRDGNYLNTRTFRRADRCAWDGQAFPA